MSGSKLEKNPFDLDYVQESGILYDNNSAFLSKLVNMNRRIQIYRNMFDNREPRYLRNTYQASTITATQFRLNKESQVFKKKEVNHS